MKRNQKNRMSISNRVIGTFNNKIEFKATHFVEDYYDSCYSAKGVN